jgi:hypothetical protein
MPDETLFDYYGLNPIEALDRNRWDYYDAILADRFRTNAVWSPLLQYVDLKAAPDKRTIGWTQGIPGHINHNPIGLRQMYKEPMTWDTRRREITGVEHWGDVVQFQKFDTYINMWRSGQINERTLLKYMAQRQLGYSVLMVMEKLARDAYLQGARFKWFGPHGEHADFSGLTRSEVDTFDISILPQAKLRMSVRANWMLDQFGTYAAPVPGKPGNMLVLTTPGVIHDIWNQKNDFMVDLRTLQDPRIMRGGAIDYQGFTFTEVPWDSILLWNAGRVDKQVGVYKYATGDGVNAARNATGVRSGDGAPNPDTTAVDEFYVGQNSAEVVHWIQCTAFNQGDFYPGQFVSIHTVQTANTGTLGVDYWGIDNGCDFLDGNTQVLEVFQADHATNRLAFRTPVMSSYETALVATGQNMGLAQNDGTVSTVAAARDVVAYVTAAQHIHPVFIAAARGAHVMSITEKVNFYLPPSVDHFQTVYTASWDMFGKINPWDVDLYEVYFVAASFGNRASGVTY